jgi:Rrf2 family protein
MKLSTQEEYGLRCLLQLARHGEGASLSIADLSRLEGLSVANVAKIMRVLRRAAFVRSTRGQAGGYALAQPADKVVVADVISRLGGRLFDARFCERHAGSASLCTHLGDCSIRPVLAQLQVAIDQVLGRLTLRQLLCSEQEMTARTGPRAISLPVVDLRSASS